MTGSLQSAVTQALLDVAIAALTFVATWATIRIGQATTKLKGEAAQLIRDDRQAALIQRGLDRINDVAAKAVASIEQTTAGTLRQAVKDGKADRASLLALSHDAYAQVVRAITPEMEQLLQTELGDLRAYVLATIEAEVGKIKASKTGELQPLLLAPTMETTAETGGGNA